MDKSKNIQFFANQLHNVDINIYSSKMILKLPFSKLSIYNASDKKEEITIPERLKKPLSEFLENYFNEEKQKIYQEINNELSI